jgi:U6 snRNA phosphodiesterase
MKSMKNLVEYSSSDSEDEARLLPPLEKKAKVIMKVNEELKPKLPMLLPSAKQSLEVKYCPEEHQSRIRSVPHVEGNWATHVFIECK